MFSQKAAPNVVYLANFSLWFMLLLIHKVHGYIYSRRVILANRCPLAFVSYWCQTAPVSGVLIKAPLKIPSVLTTHGYDATSTTRL